MNKIKPVLTKIAALILISVLFACSSAGSNSPTGTSATSGNVSVSGAYATMNAGPNTAAYMIIANSGNTAERLVAASATDATVATLHETQNNNGVMLMLPARDGFEVPARGKVELTPTGKHVMLENVKRQLKVGDTTAIVLKFQSGKEIALTLPVYEPGSHKH
ncbi:MAG: copper chaperone PCu(A)C [Anaerolineae bacterium]|nr:copper chaperone PCu(A)C [Anaerolineae bacterium]